MCGIAGIVTLGEAAPPVSKEELLRTREAMARRGPDGEGLWVSSDGRVGLAHRRLAIIDLSANGAQPMATDDGRLRITFNGEIYNYRALRAELERDGVRFRTGTDTEVLLHLYARRGAEMVHALRGMFAFGIWDEAHQELFLARDPFGIKPLYYSRDPRTLRFASQVKALLASEAVDTAPEPAGSVGFLVWGHVPEPYTLYRGIRSVDAGSWMRISRSGATQVTRYFDVREELRKAQDVRLQSPKEVSAKLRAALQDTVSHHLVSDVRVGIFLSAGLDSSTLAGVASEASGHALHAMTLGFGEYEGTSDDEVPLAAEYARRFGISHSVCRIDRRDFESELSCILAAMDQPSIDGVNTYLVSRAAARAGMKVALSGLGGDELFGGYPSFWQVPRAAQVLSFARVAPLLGLLARKAAAPVVGAFTSPKYASLLEYGSTLGGAYLLRRALYMPWEVESVLDPATVQAGLEQLQILDQLRETARGLTHRRARIAALELSWYMRNQLLRDTDWAGMAHSVEIRVPLIDVAFFRAVAPLMVSTDPVEKKDLARAMSTPPVDALLSRKKTGFTTPVRQWTSGGDAAERGLRNWARRVLPPQPRMFRALALVSDAFGGNGGIAKFNRDMLTAVASMPECAELAVAPRLISAPVGEIPPRIRHLTRAAAGKARFVLCVLREAMHGHVDLVVSGHINLAPLSAFVARLKGARSFLMIHGIDAWTPHASPFVKPSLRTFTSVVGVSRLTLDRFMTWSGVGADRLRLLPNSVDLDRYGPGPKPAELASKLGLADRTVILTLGRLASEERYKGFDEIIECLPALAERIPNVSYLICGDGPDRARLQAKARDLGVQDRVVFTGFVPESEKADYYRLADAYVMPSQGEGFGIVFLEALACGIPAMGSRVDGGREALLEGQLGSLVNPADSSEVIHGVLSALRAGRGPVPTALHHYSLAMFVQRCRTIVEEVLAQRDLPSYAWRTHTREDS